MTMSGTKEKLEKKTKNIIIEKLMSVKVILREYPKTATAHEEVVQEE